MKYIWYFAKNIHLFAGKILYINLAGMICISVFEGIGIFLLIPLLSLTGIFDLQFNNIDALSWVQPIFSNLSEGARLSIVLTCYILLISGQSFLQRSQTILNTKIQQGYLRHLREETYKTLLLSNWGFFLKKRKSDLINLMIMDIGRVNGGIVMFLQFIASTVFTIIQVGIAFWLSAKMTIAILLFGFTVIFLSRKLIRKSSEIAEETIELGKVYLSGITDQFNGIKEIKSNTLEETSISWVSSLGVKLDNNVIKMVRLNTLSRLIFKIVSAFLLAGFVFFTIKMLQSQPAQLLLILAIFTRLWPRFSSIQSNLEQIGTLIPSLKQLIDLQNECLLAKEITENSKDIKPLYIERAIECRGVSFRYHLDQPIFALHNIDALIPANQMTAIVGPSGAGKSTFIDLLMGLNQAEKGSVFLDGQPLTSENLLSLRRSVSYVPQDPFLFNSSIRENLLIMKQNASEEEIWEALEFSSAAKFVRRLPQGLDTLIGDRGIRLSGGERQRLVLARAILRKPSILVLDEATSALDSENEAKIQKAIETLKGKMTIIVIAHRLSTIRNADQVIVFDKGEIVQIGGFNQLAKEKKGLFSSLLGKQMEVV